MTVTVLLPGPLREDAGGRGEVVLEPGAATFAAVLDALDAALPVVGRRVRDETGALRRHVNAFVDGEDVRFRGGLAAAVGDGSVVHLLPAVSGG
ncbi:MAG: MoaD/ThiS family protein [Actinomycetota bacterium]